MWENVGGDAADMWGFTVAINFTLSSSELILIYINQRELTLINSNCIVI